MIHLIIALCLLIFAPKDFNYVFCLVCLVEFLVISFSLIKRDFDNKCYISFNILFCCGIFLTTFVMPIILENNVSLIVGFLSVYINESVALVIFAMSVYRYGWLRGYKTPIENKKTHMILTQRGKLILYALCSIVVIIFIYHLIIFQTSLIGTTNDLDANYLISILAPIFTVALYLNTKSNINIKDVRTFIYYNRIFLAFYLIVIYYEMFIIGDRTMPLFLILIVLSIYNFEVKPIRLIILSSFIFIFVMLLYTIGRTRTTNINYSNTSIFDLTHKTVAENNDLEKIFEDFIPAHQAMYLFLDWKEKNNDYYYPGKLPILILSPIPFIPTVLSNVIYNCPYADLNSATLSKNEYSKKIRTLYGGIGTHVVGDIYVSWGYIGIVIAFALLGYLIGRAQKGKDSFICSLILYPFIGDALYIARGTIFTDYRIIITELLIVYLLLKIGGVILLKK